MPNLNPDKSESPLSISDLVRLAKIANDQGWYQLRIEDGSTADRFLQMLSQLSITERALLFDLSSHFLTLGLGQYEPAMRGVCQQLLTLVTDDKPQITIMPLIAPKDETKNKSGGMFAYLFKKQLLCFPNFERGQIRDFSLPKAWLDSPPTKQKEILVLCDDYVGSGGTAVRALERLHERATKDKVQVVIACLCAHHRANRLIQRICPNVQIFAHYWRKRGISDLLQPEKRDHARATMKAIESRLKINSKFAFGFRRTEGLESMHIVPNNTFPVFWASETVDKKPWPALFKRVS